ncbi:MAG TPA: hypothetical protein VFC44_16305, partial [Candidatus Saccharimonadales bacterium]|nr:hypothetical protein [Candidatus Saccharimonadales bacterium]
MPANEAKEDLSSEAAAAKEEGRMQKEEEAVSQNVTADEAAALDRKFSGQRSEEILAWAWERFGRRAAIGTSFQGSGLVMMHLAR